MDFIDITVNDGNKNSEIIGGGEGTSDGDNVAPTISADVDDCIVLHEFKNESCLKEISSAEVGQFLLYWKRFDHNQIRTHTKTCVSEFTKYHDIYSKFRDKTNHLRQILISKLKNKFKNINTDELANEINEIFENELNDYENEINIRKDLIETKLGLIEEKLFSLNNPLEFVKKLLLSYEGLKYELMRYRTVNMDLRKVIDKQNTASLLKENKENEGNREEQVDSSVQSVERAKTSEETVIVLNNNNEEYDKDVVDNGDSLNDETPNIYECIEDVTRNDNNNKKYKIDEDQNDSDDEDTEDEDYKIDEETDEENEEETHNVDGNGRPIDTVATARRFKKFLKQYKITYSDACKALNGYKQSYLSHLLSRPKPWSHLKTKGREPYVQMKAFLDDKNRIKRFLSKNRYTQSENTTTNSSDGLSTITGSLFVESASASVEDFSQYDPSEQNDNGLSYDTSNVSPTIRLDTVKVVEELKMLLRKHAIPNILFSIPVLGMTHRILSKPRPWMKLGLKGRKHFIKMYLFLMDKNNIEKLKKWIDTNKDLVAELLHKHKIKIN